MAGWIYLSAAIALGGRFVFLSEKLRATLAEKDARKLFAFSVAYLAGIFAALLVDRGLAG